MLLLTQNEQIVPKIDSMLSLLHTHFPEVPTTTSLLSLVVPGNLGTIVLDTVVPTAPVSQSLVLLFRPVDDGGICEFTSARFNGNKTCSKIVTSRETATKVVMESWVTDPRKGICLQVLHADLRQGPEERIYIDTTRCVKVSS